MGTNCALLVADLFLYCYERDFYLYLAYLYLFMDSLNHDNQTDVIEAFNSTSRYLDDLSILLWWFFLFYVLVFKIFLCCWRLMYVCIFLVKLR